MSPLEGACKIWDLLAVSCPVLLRAWIWLSRSNVDWWSFMDERPTSWWKSYFYLNSSIKVERRQDVLRCAEANNILEPREQGVQNMLFSPKSRPNRSHQAWLRSNELCLQVEDNMKRMIVHGSVKPCEWAKVTKKYWYKETIQHD